MFYNTIKMRLICLHCRKGFHQVRQKPNAYALSIGVAKTDKIIALCPDCKQPMHDVGLGFKAPRAHEVRQWHRLQNFFARHCPCASCRELGRTLTTRADLKIQRENAIERAMSRYACKRSKI